MHTNAELSDDDFWNSNQKGELCLIRPFVFASFLTQNDSITLADVMLMMLNQYLYVQHVTTDTAADRLRDLNKRWAVGRISSHCDCIWHTNVLALAW